MSCFCDLHDYNSVTSLLGTEVEVEAPVTDDVAEAMAAVAVDDVVAPEEEAVGGGGVEMNVYEEVEVSATTQSYNEDEGKNSLASCSAVPLRMRVCRFRLLLLSLIHI